MTTNLTARQQEILSFIISETARRGIPPTVREIAAHLGVSSPNGVWQHVKALKDKGFLKKEPGVSRGLCPTRKEGETDADDTLPPGYPVIGEVAAGGPALAVQHGGEHLTLDDASGARPGDFLLRVKGDSMSGAGINPGDMAVVRPGQPPVNGMIAVVMVGEEEATLKRFFMETDGTVRLMPENPAYSPVVIRPGEKTVSIVGRVVGVIRRY
jgi:repressor LexA